MLVLSRKIQEQILFPALNIRITVLSVGTNRVQIGIEAPTNIDVTRPDAVAHAKGSHCRSTENRVFEITDFREDRPTAAHLQTCH